jgi:hypothetical protein
LPCGVVSGSGKIVNYIFIPLETSVLTHAFGNIYYRARGCAGCALKKQCTRNQANRTIIPRWLQRFVRRLSHVSGSMCLIDSAQMTR